MPRLARVICTALSCVPCINAWAQASTPVKVGVVPFETVGAKSADVQFVAARLSDTVLDRLMTSGSAAAIDLRNYAAMGERQLFSFSDALTTAQRSDVEVLVAGSVSDLVLFPQVQNGDTTGYFSTSKLTLRFVDALTGEVFSVGAFEVRSGEPIRACRADAVSVKCDTEWRTAGVPGMFGISKPRRTQTESMVFQSGDSAFSSLVSNIGTAVALSVEEVLDGDDPTLRRLPEPNSFPPGGLSFNVAADATSIANEVTTSLSERTVRTNVSLQGPSGTVITYWTFEGPSSELNRRRWAAAIVRLRPGATRGCTFAEVTWRVASRGIRERRVTSTDSDAEYQPQLVDQIRQLLTPRKCQSPL